MAAPNPDDSPPDAKWIRETLHIPSPASDDFASFLSGKQILSVGMLRDHASFISRNDTGSFIIPETLTGIAPACIPSLYKWAIPVVESSSQPAAKRLQQMKLDTANGLTLFVLNETLGEHDKKSLKAHLGFGERVSERVYKLSSHLFADPSAPTSLWIRDCYAVYAQRIMQQFKQLKGDVLVAGTRGIGKSAFGSLMVIHLVDEGNIVMYEHKKVKLMVIGNTPQQGQMLDVLKLLEVYRYNPVSAPGVYKFDVLLDNALFQELITVPSLTHVQDLGDDRTTSVNRDGTCRKLIVTSPNNEQLGVLHSNVGLLKLFMSRWSLEELKAARPHIFPNVQEGDLVRRFEVFNGIPRYVLEGTESDANKLLATQIAEISVQDLQNIFRSPSIVDLPSQRKTSTLIHIEPLQGDITAFRCVFASDEVARKLAEKFVQDVAFSVQGFVAAVGDIPQMSVLRGFMLEALAHKTLPHAPTIEVRELTDADIRGNPVFKSIKLPGMLITVPFDKLETVTTIMENQYIRPSKKNYPTIDSFVVMKRKYIDPTWSNPEALALVAFQVTVSKDKSKHIPDGNLLKLLRDHVFGLMPPVPEEERKNKSAIQIANERLPIALVFVTTKTGITQPQAIKNSSGEEYKKAAPLVKQYALCMGSDFEALVRQWKVKDE